MKAVVDAFNQEKALVGAFSAIVQLHRLIDLRHYYDYQDPGPGLLSRSGTRRRLSAQNMETYKYHKYTIGPTHAPPIPPTPPLTGRGHGRGCTTWITHCRPADQSSQRYFANFYPVDMDILFLLLAFSIKTLCQTGAFYMARLNIVKIKQNFVDISTTADLTLLQLECVLTFLWWYYWNAAPGPHHTFPAWQSHWNPFSSNRKICREF